MEVSLIRQFNLCAVFHTFKEIRNLYTCLRKKNIHLISNYKLNYFAGKHCEKQNLCASSPCRNGGTCESMPGGNFKCICPDGFKGQICSEDIDECKKSPCKNGGTCANTHGSYQ